MHFTRRALGPTVNKDKMPTAQQIMIILQEAEVEDMVGLVETPTPQLHLLLLVFTQGTLMMPHVTGTGQVMEVMVEAFGQGLLQVDYLATCLVTEVVNRIMRTGEGEDGVVGEVAFLVEVASPVDLGVVGPLAPEQPQALVEQAVGRYCPLCSCDILFFMFISDRCRLHYLSDLIRSKICWII